MERNNRQFKSGGWLSRGGWLRSRGWLRHAWAALVLLAVLPAAGAANGSEAAAASSSSTAGPALAVAAEKSAAPAPGSTSLAVPTTTDPSNDGDNAGEPAGDTVLLEVQINGHSTDRIAEFILRRGQLIARPDELRDLGLRVPDRLPSGPRTLISLSDLPGLTWTMDEDKGILYVTVSDGNLQATVLMPEGRGRSAESRTIESGTGVTLNYDFVNTFANGLAGATGAMEVRGFSPLGIVSSQWLGYAGGNSNATGKNTAIRLDSAYTFADVNTLRRYSLGDFITGGLAWTRPIRLEGAQIRSDFSMRPDLVTFPMPSVAGSAAVPSTVTVLADGNQAVSGQIGAGPFEIPQLPVISGAGTISMTVTNALGQQITMTQPFYASTAMLAPGLQTFAVQSGMVRRNWGP